MWTYDLRCLRIDVASISNYPVPLYWVIWFMISCQLIHMLTSVFAKNTSAISKMTNVAKPIHKSEESYTCSTSLDPFIFIIVFFIMLVFFVYQIEELLLYSLTSALKTAFEIAIQHCWVFQNLSEQILMYIIYTSTSAVTI